MANPGMFIKSYPAEAAVPGRRIVKFGAAGGILVAASATNLAIGISDQLDAKLGDMTDVIMSGSAELELGGTVAAGAERDQQRAAVGQHVLERRELASPVATGGDRADGEGVERIVALG